MEYIQEYNRYRNLIEEWIGNRITVPGLPERNLFEAMRYSLMAGGKRLRPVLSLAVCDMLGGDMEDVLPFACAIELIHTYSLIHDDLPAMDDDDMRRGIPTNHKVFGEGIAVLAGDSLLNMAYEVFLKNSLRYPDKIMNHIRAVSIIANAAGVHGMIAGQVVDLEMEGKPAQPEILHYIHTHKTGAMIEASLKAGLALEDAEQRAYDAISEYGKRLGLAFQIVDDILDVTGDAESMGKTPKSDEARHKVTFASVYGLEESRRMAEQLVEEAVSQLDYFGNKADFLKEIAYYTLRRRV